MKTCNILRTTAFLAATTLSISSQAATPYVEGQIGYANASKVNTNTYSGTVDGITATNLMGKLNYDSSASFGAEIGMKDALVQNLRIGASITTMKFDFLIQYPDRIQEWKYGFTREELNSLTSGFSILATIRL